MGVSPVSRATAPNTLIPAKITTTKVALVFAAFLVVIYALYSAKQYYSRPTLHRKPPEPPRTPSKALSREALASPRTSDTQRNVSSTATPLASTRTTNTHPVAPLSATPLGKKPKRLSFSTLPLSMTPRSPLFTSARRLTPTKSSPVKTLDDYIRLFFDRNCWKLSEKEIVIQASGQEFVLTDELLNQLTVFFQDYDPSQVFPESMINPYAFCCVLQEYSHIYEGRHPDDKGRIETLLQLHQTAKENFNHTVEDPFFFVYPITFAMIDQMNQFLDDFLELAADLRITWMVDYYESKNDPLYWCYALEKVVPRLPKDDYLDTFMKKYQEVRECIFKTPELAEFFYMDSFELDDGTEINGETLLTIRTFLSAVGKRDTTERTQALQECFKGSSDPHDLALIRFIDICEALSQNTDVYRDNSFNDRELINTLVTEYRQLKARIGRRGDPLLVFVKTYIQVKNDPLVLEMRQNAQTENCQRFFDEEDFLNLSPATAHFKSLTDLTTDDEAATWIENECQNKTGYFFEVFRFLNTPQKYTFSEEMIALLPELLKAYLAAVQKIDQLFQSKRIFEPARNALLFQKIETFLEDDEDL